MEAGSISGQRGRSGHAPRRRPSSTLLFPLGALVAAAGDALRERGLEPDVQAGWPDVDELVVLLVVGYLALAR